MKANSAFRRGFLSGEAYRSGNVDQLIGGSYDAVIVTSSWDARCLALSCCSQIEAGLGIALLFDTRDKQGLRDKHDPEIERFIRRIAPASEFVTGESCDVVAIWTKVSRHLLALRQKQGRPLRILLDLSACPRYYALATIALAFLGKLANSVRVFYAEGIYEAEQDKGDLAFTGGHWSTVAVPLLSGFFEPAKGRHYLVSAGFEGDKTYRAVSRADPDRVSILFSRPGVSPDYEARAIAANEALAREFMVRRSQLLYAPASDAIAAWRSITLSRNAVSDRFNNYFLCCGTKPHSIGLGLNAVVSGSAAVLYNIPEEHNVHRTKPSGVYWAFNLKDITALE